MNTQVSEAESGHWRCCVCKEIKSLSEFHADTRAPKGHKSYCKACENVARNARRNANRERFHQQRREARQRQKVRGYKAPSAKYDAERKRASRLSKFGVTVDEYARRLAVQGGVCAICGRPPGERRLSVDHDHVTGGVRGLLCTKCNLGLGFMRDDAAILARAIEYLKGA